MKKLLFYTVLIFNMSAFSQITHSYKIKFKDVTTLESSKTGSEFIKIMFKSGVIFDDTTDTFSLISDSPMSERAFRFSANDYGLSVILYERDLNK